MNKTSLILFLFLFSTLSNPVFAQSDQNWKNRPFRPGGSKNSKSGGYYPGAPWNASSGKRWHPGHFEVKDGKRMWVRGGYANGGDAAADANSGGNSQQGQSDVPPWKAVIKSRRSRFSNSSNQQPRSSKWNGIPSMSQAPPGQTPLRKKDTGKNPHGWALVIGISQYKYSRDQFPELKYASKDARVFYKFLCSPKGAGFSRKKVFFLENEKATLANIKFAFFDFLKKAAQDDFIIIFFTGHSTPAPDNPRNLYLLAHDSHPDYISSTALPVWEIDAAINRYVRTDRVIMLFDVCRSNGIFSGASSKSNKRNLVNKYLLQIGKTKKKRTVFTASEVGELSLESRKWGRGHGVFTYFLINGLRGEADLNDDNIVTLGETVDFVSENVRRATKDLQHPEVAGTIDRGFPLASFQPE